MVLFAVIDAVEDIPVITNLRRKLGYIQSERASIIAGGIIILFLFLGQSLLSLIGIDVNYFAVKESFILLFIALKMILGITLHEEGDQNIITVTVFPPTFLLTADSGNLTPLLSLRAEFDIQNIIISIVFKISTKIERLIGLNGIKIIHTVFSVILLAIAVKLFTHHDIKVLF